MLRALKDVVAGDDGLTTVHSKSLVDSVGGF